MRIETFAVGGADIHFVILSWFITVFWFLLFINAVNLIDGLDGLAAGVGFFTSLVMVILGVMQANYLVALEFAALGGTLLGFLRYNFNPASIFMGDGGQLFHRLRDRCCLDPGIDQKPGRGYAAHSLIGSWGAGLRHNPVSIRRWIRGRQMFRPDKRHIHHRLMEMGLSSRNAVLFIYGVSCVLCVAAILLVNLRNEMAGLLLIVLGVGAIVVVRKLGYLEYFAIDKVSGWLRDMSDVAGLSRDRRSFLNLQIDIEKANSLDDLWITVCLALELLHFDRAELRLNQCPIPLARDPLMIGEQRPDDPTVALASVSGETGTEAMPEAISPEKAQAATLRGTSRNDENPVKPERRWSAVKGSGRSAVWTREEKNGQGAVLVWAREHRWQQEDVCDHGHLRVEIPLGLKNLSEAKLILIKDLQREPIQPYTLRRVENLRHSLSFAFHRLWGL